MNFGGGSTQLNQTIIERYLLGKIDEEPHNGELWRYLGDFYYHSDALGKAQQAYERAHAIEPADAELLNNLAWLYATAKDPMIADPQRALDLARTAAGLKASPHILDTLAESYYVNGRYTEAIQAAQQALAEASENTDYYQSQLDKFKRQGMDK